MYSSGFREFAINLLPIFSILCVAVAVVLAGVFIFRDPIRDSRYKKLKKKWHLQTREMLLTKYKNDPRFPDGTIYECSTENFVTVSETGYLEFNVPGATGYVCHIKDINGVELVKDGYSNAPDIGAAGVGRMLFGDVGALIGGLGYSRKKIGRISVMFKINDFKRSLIEVKFIDESIYTDSGSYQLAINQAKKLFSQLDVLERKYREEKSLEKKAGKVQQSLETEVNDNEN